MLLGLSLCSYEFEGVDGEIHAFSGCSVAGQFEFDKRLQQLRSLISGATEEDEDLLLSDLYREDKHFRWLVDRCLVLNGIQPEWVAWTQVEQLLFGRVVEGEVCPGWLIEINQSKGDRSAKTAPEEPAGLEQFLASITEIIGSPSEAFRLVQEMPMPALLEYLNALAELRKPAEQRETDRFNEWKERKRKQMMERRHG